MSIFTRNRTELEKRAIQNRRILKERPWLWALLQEWDYYDIPPKIEIHDLCLGIGSEGQLSGSMIMNCGLGRSHTAATYCQTKHATFEQVLLCSSATPNDQWLEAMRLRRNTVKEIVVLDHEQWIVIFRVKDVEILTSLIKRLSQFND